MPGVRCRKAPHSQGDIVLTTTKKRAPSKEPAKPKKAKTAEKLPDVQPVAVKRGQERLADGRIRLKTGDHDLGEEEQDYDVHGVTMRLQGKVMIASKDVDWLSIGACQKCRTKRSQGVTINQKDGVVVVQFRCDNVASCDIGGRQYIMVQSPGRIVVWQ